jgi:chromosomal replication initiation ATPase DnaA
MIEKFTMRNPIIDKIIDIVCDDFYAERDQILSKSRRREYVIVRHATMFLCKEFTQVSLKHIGGHFGQRDHSSVIHGVTNTENLIESDKVFRQKMSDLKSRVVLALGGFKKESPDEEFYSELLYCENWEGIKGSKLFEEVEE